jgi:phenylpyruvate tautomerase PptA (4-oxalocrotonate tautomerase family)
MPLMEVTYPQGTLSAEQGAALADELTTVLLRAERAPDTEFFRSIAWVYLNELPPHAVIAGGRPVSAPTFRLDVTTPEGARSSLRRRASCARPPASPRIRLCACGCSATRSRRAAGALAVR